MDLFFFFFGAVHVSKNKKNTFLGVAELKMWQKTFCELMKLNEIGLQFNTNLKRTVLLIE